MTAARIIALLLIAAFEATIVECWNHCSPWVPRPADGYVWEHSLNEWAQISAAARRPPRQRVYGWVNQFDPKTGRRWEEQEWIEEPFAD
jgi:hypothetical protein